MDEAKAIRERTVEMIEEAQMGALADELTGGNAFATDDRARRSLEDSKVLIKRLTADRRVLASALLAEASDGDGFASIASIELAERVMKEGE